MAPYGEQLPAGWFCCPGCGRGEDIVTLAVRGWNASPELAIRSLMAATGLLLPAVDEARVLEDHTVSETLASVWESLDPAVGGGQPASRLLTDQYAALLGISRDSLRPTEDLRSTTGGKLREMGYPVASTKSLLLVQPVWRLPGRLQNLLTTVWTAAGPGRTRPLLQRRDLAGLVGGSYLWSQGYGQRQPVNTVMPDILEAAKFAIGWQSGNASELPLAAVVPDRLLATLGTGTWGAYLRSSRLQLLVPQFDGREFRQIMQLGLPVAELSASGALFGVPGLYPWRHNTEFRLPAAVLRERLSELTPEAANLWLRGLGLTAAKVAEQLPELQDLTTPLIDSDGRTAQFETSNYRLSDDGKIWREDATATLVSDFAPIYSELVRTDAGSWYAGTVRTPFGTFPFEAPAKAYDAAPMRWLFEFIRDHPQGGVTHYAPKYERQYLQLTLRFSNPTPVTGIAASRWSPETGWLYLPQVTYLPSGSRQPTRFVGDASREPFYSLPFVPLEGVEREDCEKIVGSRGFVPIWQLFAACVGNMLRRRNGRPLLSVSYEAEDDHAAIVLAELLGLPIVDLTSGRRRPDSVRADGFLTLVLQDPELGYRHTKTSGNVVFRRAPGDGVALSLSRRHVHLRLLPSADRARELTGGFGVLTEAISAILGSPAVDSDRYAKQLLRSLGRTELFRRLGGVSLVRHATQRVVSTGSVSLAVRIVEAARQCLDDGHFAVRELIRGGSDSAVLVHDSTRHLIGIRLVRLAEAFRARYGVRISTAAALADAVRYPALQADDSESPTIWAPARQFKARREKGWKWLRSHSTTSDTDTPR